MVSPLSAKCSRRIGYTSPTPPTRTPLYTTVRLIGLAALRVHLPSPLENAVVLRADAVLSRMEAQR